MKQNKLFKYLIISTIAIFIFSIVSLFFGDELAASFNVIGIRIAVLIVAFASFISSALFSFLVYAHNKTVSKINDDMNKRAELFRELQFASANYSIIEFTDRMLIYKESERYKNKYLNNPLFGFHLIETVGEVKDIEVSDELYDFYSIRIPFKVLEGKMVSRINVNEIRFEKENEKFYFYPTNKELFTEGYILYNEQTKRNNLIVNLIVDKKSNFFNQEVNVFTKIKLVVKVSSLLGVGITGINELYFTNPTQTEGDGLHTYKINSSNFTLIERPRVDNLSEIEGQIK
ncbi:conserved hypothetical protein [Alteracholeplasma palmae J233]|uniref:Uncharacterized protein n=1 Tax=Alteracholeplasma palmae (strain ATCC 49389 / J233) TaxID=1318466 RepID=U4KLS2_ALTPJ|nr:hypothetical protein [Alteracholeplasma palmae]CCV64872.1 conserved hypothetical protein [Alteracholeplasma palmae J233]